MSGDLRPKHAGALEIGRLPGIFDEEADDIQSSMENALRKVMGKSTKDLACVDLRGGLEELGLEKLFPQTVWPPVNAMRELATKLKEREKRGETGLF
eukprot:4746674-Karenia_brevis.AAC.1